MTIVTELKGRRGRQVEQRRGPRLKRTWDGSGRTGEIGGYRGEGQDTRCERRDTSGAGTLTPEANQATGTEQRGRAESREEALCVTQTRGA